MSQKDNLVWMDLEMTGLEPEQDVIIEVDGEKVNDSSNLNYFNFNNVFILF